MEVQKLRNKEKIKEIKGKYNTLKVFTSNGFGNKKASFKRRPRAQERNRTFTSLRMADFESAASTNFATWAGLNWDCNITLIG